MCAVFIWLNGGTDSALSSSSFLSLLDSCETLAPSSLSFSSSEVEKLSPISMELVGMAGGGEMLDCKN